MQQLTVRYTELRDVVQHTRPRSSDMHPATGILTGVGISVLIWGVLAIVFFAL